MRRSILGLILVSFSFLATAAPEKDSSTLTPKFTWTRGVIQNGQGENFAEVYGIASDSSGNVFITGRFCGDISFGTTNLVRTNTAETVWMDSYFAKFNAGGELLWVKQGTVTENHVEGWSVACDKAGNSYFLGTIYNGANFGDVAFTNTYGAALLKYDPKGKLLWSRVAHSAEPTRMILDKDENIIITGTAVFGPAHFGNGVTLPAVADFQFFVAKYDSDGNALWARTADSGITAGGSVAVSGSGDIYVAGIFGGDVTFGNTALSGGTTDCFVAKYSASGTFQWARQSTIGAARPTGIGVDRAGRVFVCGWYEGSGMFENLFLEQNTYGFSMFLAGMNENGDVNWAKSIANAIPNMLAVDANGTARIVGGFQRSVIFGSSSFSSGGLPNGFLASCNANGDFVSALTYGSDSSAWTTAVNSDARGNIFTAGTFVYDATIGNVTLKSSFGQNIFFNKLTTK